MTMTTGLIETTEDLFSLESPADVEPQCEEGIADDAVLRDLLRRGPFSCDDRYVLKTEAHLLHLAHANNKILSLSNSRTRILAHQVESTHRIVNSLNKRFLIADEVGLGKTIEAGLVIKELVYRHDYRRILIVCPASLLLQWQNEMRSKFNEDFAIMDRKGLSLASHGGGNPWKGAEKIICSLDFIKNRAFADDLKNVRWDAVIFDEAHRLRRDSKHATQAYVAGEMISRRTRSLLLLSATPFRGNLEELYYLVSLVDRNLLGPFNSFYLNYCHDGSDLSSLRRRISDVVIRRTKKEVGGFTLRHARTVRFDLYPDERLLYDETTAYVAEEFNRAMQSENRAVGFVMTVFQKLLDSSSHALCVALMNRRERLMSIAEKAESALGVAAEFDAAYPDAAEDDDLRGVIGETTRKTLGEIREEIKTLERLIALAGSIEKNKKAEKLAGLVRDLKKKGHGKFLIFTQFRTTQDYLSRVLSSFSVEVFHGSMDRMEKENALERFRDRSDILIATEAGGEGRNIQFCNILINYDLPWSPLKIEQRIGRVHRFGQKHDVYIFNFSTRDTVAERVLEVLSRKLKLFEESIGTPDVLLGEMEDELKLSKLFMEMASGSKSTESIGAEIDQRLETARKSFEKLSDLTVASQMDFNYDEYYRITLKERQFSNRRIEQFVNLLQKTEPDCLASIGRRDGESGLYPVCCGDRGDGCSEGAVRQGTFDSIHALENEKVEFLAFGHPVVDALIERCKSDCFGGSVGAVAIRHPRPFVAMVFNYIVTYRSFAVSSEMIPVVVDPRGVIGGSELLDIEKDLLEQDYLDGRSLDGLEHELEALRRCSDECCFAARERALTKIQGRIADMAMTLDLDIYPEMEKIEKSHGQRIRELQERMAVQESRMKWQGVDMKGAITRTAKLIQKEKRERDHLLQTYRQALGITYRARLVNVAALVGRP
jgi:superfamily II DNA or RNA helicase/uncharacterized protein (UPF0335 family)